MDIVTFLFTWAFNILNLTISIPLDFEKIKYLTFPLWLPVLVFAIGELLLVLWQGIMISHHNIE